MASRPKLQRLTAAIKKEGGDHVIFDRIANGEKTIVCGSEEGRSIWCVATGPGEGFLLTGSSSEFTKLSRE